MLYSEASDSAGHGFVMKIGDFGMSRHVCVTKRPDGTTSLVRQMSTGNLNKHSTAQLGLNYS